MQPIQPDQIVASLTASQSVFTDLIYEASLDSTNDYLWRQHQSGEPIHGRICITDYQTAGKGRRGRMWVADAGQNITMSLAWRVKGVPIPSMSLAVGVAIATVLRRAGYESVGLKWPNDILALGAKLGGILVEAKTDGGFTDYVIGIGLNVDLSTNTERAVGQAIIDLKQLSNRSIDRSGLIAELVISVEHYLCQLEAQGFQAIQPDWQEMHAMQGEAVQLELAETTHRGRIAGVDVDGALRLQTPSGMRTFNSGEVSLRPVAGQ